MSTAATMTLRQTMASLMEDEKGGAKTQSDGQHAHPLRYDHVLSRLAPGWGRDRVERGQQRAPATVSLGGKERQQLEPGASDATFSNRAHRGAGGEREDGFLCAAIKTFVLLALILGTPWVMLSAASLWPAAGVGMSGTIVLGSIGGFAALALGLKNVTF